MNVGFAGTPRFAADVLASLIDGGFRVSLVLTQPDRPQSRGLKSKPSPVKELAQRHAITVGQPSSLASETACADLLAIPLDVLVVAAYGLILPPALLSWPRLGCVNVHASLLPRWRGAAPIQRALLAGDTMTGVTLMQMDAGLDTGAILESVDVPIDTRETAGSLERKLAGAGARSLVALLRRTAEGAALVGTPQPAKGATYAAKIAKSEAAIDWRRSATDIDRQIRAFNPVPGAYTGIKGQIVKVWRAEPSAVSSSSLAPATIVDMEAEGMIVACGEGSLLVSELQPAGGRRMTASAFVAGRRIASGDAFQTPLAECRKPSV